MILIGLGNPFRRDDGVGPEILRRLPDLPSRYCEGDPLRLMAALDGLERAVIVVAVEGEAPGRIHRWVWPEVPRESMRPRLSSHGMSLFDALRLLEQSDRLPATVVVYGLEGEDFGWGEGFSAPVGATLSRLESMVRGELLSVRDSTFSDSCYGK